MFRYLFLSRVSNVSLLLKVRLTNSFRQPSLCVSVANFYHLGKVRGKNCLFPLPIFLANFQFASWLDNLALSDRHRQMLPAFPACLTSRKIGGEIRLPAKQIAPAEPPHFSLEVVVFSPFYFSFLLPVSLPILSHFLFLF